MSRTNMEIDDELIDEAMRRYQVPTKREAVDLALRRLIGPRVTSAEILALEGIGWSGDLQEMREDNPEQTWTSA